MTPDQIKHAAKIIAMRDALLGERELMQPVLCGTLTVCDAGGYRRGTSPLTMNDEEEVGIVQTAIHAIIKRRIDVLEAELKDYGVTL